MEKLKGLIAVLGTATTWLLGTWDIALIVLVCFMTLDYITGLMKGRNKKELSSYTARMGIAKKV